jgi:iron-sulfur cluster repair protein YtfE (RIC family)
MASIHDVMAHDHRVCDDYFSEAENAVSDGDWPGAEAAWQLFRHALDNHITRLEEGLLFPAFEAINGTAGPTRLMGMEHEQVRTLVESMQQALSRRDTDEFAGLSETLMLLLQQHNMKEEQILYPLMDGSLADPAAFAATLQLQVSAGGPARTGRRQDQ